VKECVQPWVVWVAADLVAAGAVVAAAIAEAPVAVAAVADADLVVAGVAEVRAAVKPSATASPSQLTFRTFLTTQISAGRSAT